MNTNGFPGSVCATNVDTTCSTVNAYMHVYEKCILFQWDTFKLFYDILISTTKSINSFVCIFFEKVKKHIWAFDCTCVGPCRSVCEYARLWVSLESVKTIMQTDTSEMRGWLPGDRRWGGCSRGDGVRCSLNDVWLELRSVRRAQTCLMTGWEGYLSQRGVWVRKTYSNRLNMQMHIFKVHFLYILWYIVTLEWKMIFRENQGFRRFSLIAPVSVPFLPFFACRWSWSGTHSSFDLWPLQRSINSSLACMVIIYLAYLF